MIEKTPSGRFRARLKSGRQFVASRTFDTKREASDWLSREKAALAGGIDPRAGRRQLRTLLEEWLVVREFTVAAKTYRSDQALQRLVPASMQAMHVAAVSEREIARSFEVLIQRGLSERSVIRYRASLSTFFAWCAREKAVVRNPVTATKVPRSSEEPTEMRPWTEAELEATYERWKARDPQLADVLLVLGWTGMRWGEARALLVEDIVVVPTPGLLVRRSQSEGGAVKATKGRRGRRVPVADRVLPIIQTSCGQGTHRPPDHHGGGLSAASQRGPAHGQVGPDLGRPPHPRPAPHRRMPMAGSRRRPRNRPGVDGTRVDRHHDPLPALPRHLGGPGRTGPAQ